jgi:hypothetical protein
MSSHQRTVADIECESVRVRINLYKQMKEQDAISGNIRWNTFLRYEINEYWRKVSDC